MRRVLVVKTGRADITPLDPVIRELRSNVDCDLYQAQIGADTPVEALQKMGRNWKRIPQPDIVVLLGDRYETLMAAATATFYQVPICHIHGGEITLGSFDNQIRYAITALSHLHCTAAEPYSERLRDIGERYVWTCGAPGLDNLVDLPDRDPQKIFIVTYHPETAGDFDNKIAVDSLHEALNRFPNYSVMWTAPNRDPGSVNMMRIGLTYMNWTAKQYLKACRQAACVIGNSSSGIIECPSLGVPTVNVGERQAGRLRAPSVFDAKVDVDHIAAAITSAIQYDGPWRNPHESGGSKRIANAIMTVPLDEIKVKTWRL
jgi:UDP-hydrolysing UDP-N-acetyl-D-glucosamine 2-epimerase